MKMKKIIGIVLLFIVMVVSLQFCNGDHVDQIVKKYDQTDFSDLKGFSIHYRDARHQENTFIYLVSTYDVKCSPYMVEVDGQNSIVNINNNLVLESCGRDYLTKEKIKQVFAKYSQYHFCLLQVDNEGNVYINPDNQERPTLLRKSVHSNPKDLALFSHYKGNWYTKGH